MLYSESSPYEFDLFGTNRIDIGLILKDFGNELQAWAEAWSHQREQTGDWDLKKSSLRDSQKELEEEIRKAYGFAYVQINGIHYWTDEIKKDFVILDVVEEKEKAERMPFLPPPQGSYPDPEGVFATLDEYFKVGMDLSQRGLLGVEDLNDTEISFHTVFGHCHPKLAPYRVIGEIVKRHQQEIETIFLDDSDEYKRAHAAFLLAYLKDGKYLINLLQKRLKDSSPEVRNNVMRVYTYIAMKHPEMELPVNDLVEALNYPSFGDRNKAVGTLYMLAQHPEQLAKHRSAFIKAVPLLNKLLTQKQPNVHDPAKFILNALSEFA